MACVLRSSDSSMGVGWKDLLHGKGLGYVYLTALTGVAIAYGVAALECK